MHVPTAQAARFVLHRPGRSRHPRLARYREVCRRSSTHRRRYRIGRCDDPATAPPPQNEHMRIEERTTRETCVCGFAPVCSLFDPNAKPRPAARDLGDEACTCIRRVVYQYQQFKAFRLERIIATRALASKRVDRRNNSGRFVTRRNNDRNLTRPGSGSAPAKRLDSSSGAIAMAEAFRKKLRRSILKIVQYFWRYLKSVGVVVDDAAILRAMSRNRRLFA